MNKFYHHFSLLILLLGITFINGCSPGSPLRQEHIDLTAAGFLSLFLNHSATETQLHINLSEIEILAADVWYPLTADPNHQTKPDAAQQLLAASPLATGLYTRIRFQLTVTSPAGELLRQEQTELPLAQPLELKRGDSSCLFINSRLSIQHLNQPLPQQLQVWLQQRPLADELLYILCPDIQTLYVARIDPCRIVAAYGIGEDIADIVLDNERKLLYLLDRRYRQIRKFDAINQTLTDRIPLPLTDQPGDLGISADGKTLYVSDPENHKLLQIDAANGFLKQQRTTNYQPGKAYPFDYQQQPWLALLYPRDQQLEVMPAQTLVPLYSINVGLQPYDIAYADQALFVSDKFSRQILKIDPASGRTLGHIATAFIPGTLTADPVNRNLIIGLCREQAIAFLPYGQQLVARRAALGGCPEDLVLTRHRRLLFSALPDKQQVSVMDIPSEKELGVITIASRPTNIVFQEP